MKQRSFFVGVLVVLFGVMGYWANRLESRLAQVQVGGELRGIASTVPEPMARTQSRRELLEILDRLVAYQHYYRSVYGHFTKLIHRTGFVIPKQVLSNYAVHVAEAADDHLMAVGTSESDGHTQDVVSIDQQYRVQANFPLPPPRPEFLKAQALRHLRLLKDSPAGQLVEEQGIYRGYFKYEVRKDSNDRRVAFAVGTRAPVAGLQLDGSLASPSSGGAGNPALEEASVGDFSGVMGQSSINETESGANQTFLAQRIFQGEMGRYARNLRELAQITHFSFEEENRSRSALSIETIDGRPAPVAPPTASKDDFAHQREPASSMSLQPSAALSKPLIVEPIDEPRSSRKAPRGVLKN